MVNSSAPATNIPDVPGHPLTVKDKQNVAAIVQIYSSPISFWGKVIDQNQRPIPDAKISYGAVDKYFSDNGSKYKGRSDENGLFSIVGIHGIALYVEISKDGYYQMGEKSMRGFANGSNEMPTKDNPAIFELRKRGQTEPLIMIERNVKIPRDGTPTRISLVNGRTINFQNDGIQVQAWTNDAAVPVNSGQRYDWRYVIAVPGGGLQSRADQFDFEAPESGYQPTDEITMPANADRWRDQARRSYFVRLGNGDYARIDFQMIAGGDHFFIITSYLNPIPGHRNLEYDPENFAPSGR